MRHTPGPWKATAYHSDNSIGIEGVRKEQYEYVCHIEYLTDVGIANSHLIEAAPDLLEACEDYFAAEETMDPGAWKEAAEDAMRKAIAKAKGRQP